MHPPSPLTHHLFWCYNNVNFSPNKPWSTNSGIKKFNFFHKFYAHFIVIFYVKFCFSISTSYTQLRPLWPLSKLQLFLISLFICNITLLLQFTKLGAEHRTLLTKIVSGLSFLISEVTFINSQEKLLMILFITPMHTFMPVHTFL